MTRPIKNIRDLLIHPDEQAAALEGMQNYLRANLHPDNHPDEHLYVATMPGDPTHPLEHPPNPYMKHGFMNLKRLWDKGLIPEDKIPEVRRAMYMLSEGQAWDAPPSIAVDQTETLVYEGNMNGDEDIWDPGATTFAPKFQSTVLHSDE